MLEKDYRTFINGVGNDLKMSIDDFISAFGVLYDDIEKLKINGYKPDKKLAKYLLEYIAMEESETKSMFEALCRGELQKYFNWLDKYSAQSKYSHEEILNKIISGEI